MFQLPGLPSRRCGKFLNQKKTPLALHLHGYYTAGGLDRASLSVHPIRASYPIGRHVDSFTRSTDERDAHAPFDSLADVHTDSSTDKLFRPIDLETLARPPMHANRSRSESREADDFELIDAGERTSPPTPMYLSRFPPDGQSSYTDEAHDTEASALENITGAPVPQDNHVSVGLAGEDDDTELDDEVIRKNSEVFQIT